MAVSGPPADRWGVQKPYAIGYACGWNQNWWFRGGTAILSVYKIRHKGLENLHQTDAQSRVQRRGCEVQLSIEREIELTSQKGSSLMWQAYGLYELELTIPPTVYPPREDSSLLDQTIAELGPGDGKHLLEIGCGSGAISIAAAKRGWIVSACDINPLAVAATRGNASKHGLDWNSEIKEGGPGDIGKWMPDEGADIIAWNLPYIEPDPVNSLGPMEDSALIGNDEAKRLMEAIESNPYLLNPNGIVLMLHSSNQLGHYIGRDWRRRGWATRNLSHRTIGDERLTVIACWRPFEGSTTNRLEKCDSTNDEILSKGMVEQGTFLSTECQIGGRGYAGRKWFNSEGGFMGSWALSGNSINQSPEFLQMASNVALLDAFSALLDSGLPSHSWVHGSTLEQFGFRVKWPNDIWLRKGGRIGKLCGILVEGRTQGDDVQIVLGVGINKRPNPELDLSIGWESLFEIEFDELFPVIHASVASLMEKHELIPDCKKSDILNSVYSTMRRTLSEGGPLAFGLDQNGGLRVPGSTIRTTGDVQWVWD